ncbi:hypothetical protein ABT340_15585 [Streptosporangium sp. NPDC000239]|uniref:hypothetical protein n=1 Tax=Streptosporangium sp. NPDC000239 TaxID=3154248 RepID=UPI003322FFEB
MTANRLTFFQRDDTIWLVPHLPHIPLKDVQAEHNYGDPSLVHLVIECPEGYEITEEPDPMPTSQRIAAASDLARQLVAQIGRLEIENAELQSRLAATQRSDLRAKAKRHVENYRRKLHRAQNAGDLTAASQADQRVRAIEKLLEL